MNPRTPAPPRSPLFHLHIKCFKLLLQVLHVARQCPENQFGRRLRKGRELTVDRETNKQTVPYCAIQPRKLSRCNSRANSASFSSSWPRSGVHQPHGCISNTSEVGLTPASSSMERKIRVASTAGDEAANDQTWKLQRVLAGNRSGASIIAF